MAYESEWILRPVMTAKPVTEVRSTLLISSRQALTAAGYEARYLEALAPADRVALADVVAGVWLPVRLAEAHYRACDSLALGPEATLEAGRATGKKMEGIVLGTAVRLMREAGVTPWTVLEQFQRFWTRAFVGGNISVLKLGPKDARVAYAQCSLCDIPYFRAALRGVAQSLLTWSCERIYMTEIPGARRPRSATYRFQWA